MAGLIASPAIVLAMIALLALIVIKSENKQGANYKRRKNIK